LFIIAFAPCRADSAWVIRFDGIGPAMVGMSVSQLDTALHESFSPPRDKDEQLCYSVDSPKHPGVSFMLENAHITRVDVDGSAMATAEGIRVGDTEARVKQVYGSRLKVEPNAYSGSADPVLTMRSADGRYGIRFITKKRKVRLIYAGRWQSIQYIEGCE